MSNEKLCRLCMGRSNLIHSVLDDNLIQKIAICVSIMINPADKILPLELCALCALKVKDFFEFRQNCLKVQQLLEQDACSMNVESLSPELPLENTVKQEKLSSKSEEQLSIAKFEVIIDEDDRLSGIQDTEESVEEDDHLIEQLEDIAAEVVLVEDLVEQDDVLSETEQAVELEQVTESDGQHIDYEIRMIELNYDHNPSETGTEEDENFNDEEQIVNSDGMDEDHFQQVVSEEVTSKASLGTCPVMKEKQSHEPKQERNEKEIYKSLLQKCSTCGKLVERNRMEGHTNRHLNFRPYVCTEANCGSTFHCKISLRLHNRNRHGTEELHCDLCGKVYFSKKALYHHKKESHAEKQFSCEECGLVFVSNARLNRHKVTHSDEREFKCPHCPKEFYRSNNLKVHIRSHTKEKPFSCSSCDKAFGYQRLLREHINRHHKGNFVL